jgi:hypothetical protein
MNSILVLISLLVSSSQAHMSDALLMPFKQMFKNPMAHLVEEHAEFARFTGRSADSIRGKSAHDHLADLVDLVFRGGSYNRQEDFERQRHEMQNEIIK